MWMNMNKALRSHCPSIQNLFTIISSQLVKLAINLVEKEALMPHTVERAIEGYLNAVEQVHGKAFRAQTEIRHTGGSDVVIALPEGHKSIVSIGRLNLMAEHLKRQSELAKAA